jgi:hypothetical protein
MHTQIHYLNSKFEIKAFPQFIKEFQKEHEVLDVVKYLNSYNECDESIL